MAISPLVGRFAAAPAPPLTYDALSRTDLFVLSGPSVTDVVAPQMIDRVDEILLRLRRDGLSLLIVEQSTERALAAADRMYIMRNGEIRFVGRSDLSSTEGQSNRPISRCHRVRKHRLSLDRARR